MENSWACPGILPHSGAAADVQLYPEEEIFSEKRRHRHGKHRPPAFIPALEQALRDPEELVRGYAAWAMGKIGGPKSRQLLESGLAGETAESVIKELKAALLFA